MTTPYYVDSSEASLGEDQPRTIYDQNGMPAITVSPDNGKWTDERQAMLETVLKAVNGDQE